MNWPFSVIYIKFVHIVLKNDMYNTVVLHNSFFSFTQNWMLILRDIFQFVFRFLNAEWQLHDITVQGLDSHNQDLDSENKTPLHNLPLLFFMFTGFCDVYWPVFVFKYLSTIMQNIFWHESERLDSQILNFFFLHFCFSFTILLWMKSCCKSH